MSLCSEKLTLWIFIEGSSRFKKFPVEWNDSPPDLDDLASRLCEKEDILNQGTLLTNLYPFSDSEVRCQLSTSWFRSRFQHTNGLCEVKKKINEEQVDDDFALNKIIEEVQPDERGKREIGKQAYGEWEIGEVLEKILHKSARTIYDINQFDITEKIPPDPEISVAVEHVQSKESKLYLKSEEWLDGSRGFGPVNYSVYLEEFVLLVCEAKKENFEKGAAQNIVQMHSSVADGFFFNGLDPPKYSQLEVSGPHMCDFGNFGRDEMIKDAKKIANYIAFSLQMQISDLDSNKKLHL
ncbi:14452_t:CDS:2 [Ambispora leptoticha]|uniref:14452_t:CDS:1 n=1 Tax=Ambispora leptoticha TaxID=144679 RepID=A0A9N8W8Y4_9GLOM|nr:14452_t:CDS:2 [Ambispora leptoticha]